MSVSDWIYAQLRAELDRVGIDTTDLLGMPVHIAAQRINDRLGARGMSPLPVIGVTSLPEVLAMVEAHFGCQEHTDRRNAPAPSRAGG